jgi:hypothetical protein
LSALPRSFNGNQALARRFISAVLPTPNANYSEVRIYLPHAAAESSISPFFRMDFHSRTRATLRTSNPELAGPFLLEVSV